MNYRSLIYLITVILVTACAPVTPTTKGSYLRLTPRISAPVEPSSDMLAKIKVFYRQDPDFDYIEVGIIEALAYGSEIGLHDLFLELKKQAVLVGGTAIHKIEIQRHNQTGDTIHATAVAILPK